jgi:hypothetical protein
MAAVVASQEIQPKHSEYRLGSLLSLNALGKTVRIGG